MCMLNLRKKMQITLMRCMNNLVYINIIEAGPCPGASAFNCMIYYITLSFQHVHVHEVSINRERENLSVWWCMVPSVKLVALRYQMMMAHIE